MQADKLAEAIAKLREVAYVMSIEEAHEDGWFSIYDVYAELGLSRQGCQSRLKRCVEDGSLKESTARREDGKILTVYHHV